MNVYMKKLIVILSFTVGLISLAGCSDYLDSDYIFDERMSIDDVFHNKDYTNNWLALRRKRSQILRSVNITN